MHFDGARSRHGAGAGIMLISLAGEETIHYFHLEFDCTNNVAEYEAFLLGLELARDIKIKCLSVIGDSDLIVSQVRNQFVAKCYHPDGNLFFKACLSNLTQPEESDRDGLMDFQEFVAATLHVH